MLKRIMTIAALALSSLGFTAAAQAPAPQQLPINPKVRHGVLPNGLNYYILHNEEPKERANFYIAQKVGSTLETPQQLGLAHFLEHMAFNGSKNFPGKLMLEYLQSKGIRFGADINAYTAFDETVYNINNIRTNDRPLVDSVLLMLHDWSCDLSLLDAEIDAERGVIQEEWRSRNSAQIRMFTSVLPKLFKEYQYTRMPIGTMDIVMNFPYQDLKDYYEKWYRPDQQGIVIVGDIDVDEMERKVKEIFTPIEMPANAAPREYPTVSDNKGLIYASFEDPEMQFPLAQMMFKYDKIPFELRNTDQAYTRTVVLENLFTAMVNARFQEMSQKPDCPFAMAAVSFGDFMVAKTKGALTLTVIAKTSTQEALKAAMGELARSCQTGFTDSELQRAKSDMLALYEKSYNEREKTASDALGKEIIRHFVDNEPMPGIEAEYQTMQTLLPLLPVAPLNALAKTLLTADNQALIVAQPKRDGMTLPTEEEVTAIISGALGAQYEAYKDEVITEPLIKKLRKAGKVTATGELAQYGAKTYTLSNGAKMIFKPTDFAKDQINITAIRNGGKSLYKGANGPETALVEDAVEVSRLGSFDNTMLTRYLAGKNVSTSFNMALYSDRLSGRSSVKDLETMLELMYATFTDIQPDADAYAALRSQLETVLSNAAKDPEKIFMDKVYKTWYNNNPYTNMLDLATVKAADYNKMVAMAKAALANAADYTFVVTGNIDEATLLPLAAKYLASLPADKKKKAPAVDYIVRQAQGQVVNEFEEKIEAPIVKVFNILNGSNLQYTPANAIMLKFLGNVLSNVFTETLREEEGGTYSPYASTMFNPQSGEWSLFYTYSTGADKKATINKRAIDETLKLLANGTDAAHFNKVKEAAINQYNISLKKNDYWNNQLLNYVTGTSIFDGYGEALNSVTLEQFNAFMHGLYNGKNRIEVIMDGVKK